MKKQLIRKNKLSVSLALALGMGMAASSGTALAVELDNNDRLGDAGIFQYYTVNGGWQTFIRIINTSDEGASVKIRFREAANSREVLDFIVFLSPYDVWVGWTDPDATGQGNPGVRTNDTSCLYPNQGNTLKQGFIGVPGKPGVRGADFKDFAYTDPYYDDGGNSDHTPLQRMSEGHVEVIGIARHEVGELFTAYITHETDGEPLSCSSAATLWETDEGDEGAKGKDLDNVLAMNGYLINVTEGKGAGFDPDILINFAYNSLWEAAHFTATDPDMDSADPGFVTEGVRFKQKGILMNLLGSEPVTGGVDAVSYEFMRASVINEWAASNNPGNIVSDYFTQWIGRYSCN
jgi:hypothetical protein